MALETVNVDTITAIAKINPIELIIERPFRLERFLETKVNVRRFKSPFSLASVIGVQTVFFFIRTIAQNLNHNRTKVGEDLQKSLSQGPSNKSERQRSTLLFIVR